MDCGGDECYTTFYLRTKTCMYACVVVLRVQAKQVCRTNLDLINASLLVIAPSEGEGDDVRELSLSGPNEVQMCLRRVSTKRLDDDASRLYFR
ncbi:hypothetical protein E2C01_101115 [Portunus trituberculatus]|uniref:Uncharacterized protein n=1 Tax=Portunus trituberculatus TaxID=210409 RepID=A0A5B7KL60_PORTR|nr:hypothetical protein [Portunus trituberculatus]